jgi:hypothetical protein
MGSLFLIRGVEGWWLFVHWVPILASLEAPSLGAQRSVKAK